jgi:hypothetical protein
MKNIRLAILSILLLLCAAYLFYTKVLDPSSGDGIKIKKGIIERTYANYGDETASAASNYNLPQEYLLALIALECSGRKIIPHRFEPHVYQKLQKVKSGTLPSLERVTHNGIKNMSNDAVKNLSRSWGPFQLMGYKVFELGVMVEDLRGKKAVMVGARWIDKSYGQALKEQRFKDAFHIHNTGSPYPKSGVPKTYNKNYIPKGLTYMEQFKEIIGQ